MISPNPANEAITISYEIIGSVNALKLCITDALGKTVFEKGLTTDKGQELLEVKNFAKGNYICTVYNNGKPILNGKFIKE